VIAVTRRYRFPAAHILRSDAFSDAENERVYGKCANPAGHGHDYGLEVTLAGPIDAATGAIFPIDRLDALVHERVLDRLSHRLLNEDAWFAVAVPTAENIALAIEREMREAVGAESAAARVVRVRLLETRRNFFACGEAEA
jgi:6-pyruvoyltetrahydropterin/6-carboxytetrahydropterin synthase